MGKRAALEVSTSVAIAIAAACSDSIVAAATGATQSALAWLTPAKGATHSNVAVGILLSWKRIGLDNVVNAGISSHGRGGQGREEGEEKGKDGDGGELHIG